MKDLLTKLRKTLVHHLPLLVFVFCVLQPLLDVAAYWQGALGYKSLITTLLRFGGFAGVAFVGFFLSDRKRLYFLTAGLFGIFAVLRCLALTEAGYTFPAEDLMNLLRFFMLPIYTLGFCTMVKKNPGVFQAILNGFAVDLAIIAAVMAISHFTGTDPHTYPNKELGILGWFLMGNPQSSIVSMLVPVSIGWALMRWEKQVLPVAIVTFLGEAMLFFLATRLSCMAMAAAGIGMAVCVLIIDRSRWRQSCAIGLITIAMVLALPVSPMVENQKLQAQNYDNRQILFDEIAMPEDTTADPDTQTQRLIEAYRLYVPGLVTRFGGARTIEAYGRTTDVDIVANRRTMRLTFCRLLAQDSPKSAKWFGMDVTRMKVQGVDLNWVTGETEDILTSFDPENDFHAVYYLYGIVGLCIIVCFFLYFAIRAFYAMLSDFRKNFTIPFAALAIACCCALAHYYFTASTLRFINTQAYLALLLAAISTFFGSKSKAQT